MNLFLFDIDGTLVSTGGAGIAALEAGLAEEFGIGGCIEKLTLSGRTDRAIATDLLRLSGLADSDENRSRLQEAYLRHLPSCLHRLRGRILPGVVELLERLRQRPNTMIGLLTGNIRHGARIKLGHFGLAEHFAFGGFGDRHLDRDEVAREALAAWQEHVGYNSSPQCIWVIGDTPHDITCARAIAARSVAVATGWHPREELANYRPDVLLDDLTRWAV